MNPPKRAACTHTLRLQVMLEPSSYNVPAPEHCLKVLFPPPRRPPPRTRTHYSCRRLTLAAQSCNLVDALFEEERDGKWTAGAVVHARTRTHS